MIHEFLTSILGETEGRATIWRRRKYGRNSPIDSQQWFQYPRDIDKMVTYAQTHADIDVYFSPSLYNQDERQPQYTTEAATVWCDADSADPSVFRLQPSYVVQSSPNRWQTYWVLDKPVRAAEASRMARTIAYAHRHQGADISSWPSNKLMRVVGTTNSNYDWPHEVVGEPTGTIYSLEEMHEAYADVDEAEISAPADRKAIERMPAPTDLPAFMDAQQLLPADFPLQLITDTPADGLRSEMRWKLIAELVEAGLDDENVAALAWEAKCSEKWHDDPRGIEGLWMEIAKERQRYDEKPKPEEGAVAEVKPVKLKQQTKPQRLEILTASERKMAKERFKASWLYEYQEWVARNIKNYNRRYMLGASLMALSNTIGQNARLIIRGQPVPLNLFSITVGPTTSGKSEAKFYMKRTISECYIDEGNVNIGSNVSTQAIFEYIHSRAEQSTMLLADEAHSFIESMRDKSGWQRDLMAKITELYDGDAEPQMRRGDTQGEHTKTSFSMSLWGVEDEIVSVLDRKMFKSGFLARVLWFIGEQSDMDIEDQGVQFTEQGLLDRQDDQLAIWKKRFLSYNEVWAYKRLTNGNRIPNIWPDSDETAQWFQKKTAKIQSGQYFPDSDEARLLSAVAIRSNNSTAKIAALLAISEGRDSITRDDFAVALWIMEDCLGDMLYMFNQVASTEHSKALDMLEIVIASNPAGLHSSEVYRIMMNKVNPDSRKGFSKRDVEALAGELLSQRRLTQRAAKDGVDWRVIG